MKISIKNLGVIRQAELTLGDLTIICGKNNTGKTYVTYALYGFLAFWKNFLQIEIPKDKIDHLLTDGSITLDLNNYVKKVSNILQNGCQEFTSQLSKVFASSPKRFIESSFAIEIDAADISLKNSFRRAPSTATTGLFTIEKKSNSSSVVVTLLIEKDNIKISQEVVNRIIGDSIKDIIFGGVFPKPFIASAERTGAAIFRKELDFARNRLLEAMNLTEKNIDPLTLFSNVYSDYALPVKSEVGFIRQLEDLAKKDSFISEQHESVLKDFADIIGGDYTVTKDNEFFYEPKDQRVKLTMDESSSSVRSLLDIGFYLRYVAEEGDILMVDEPELNLHPENQRRVARLFASLVNIGIKVFITTHSDYIIKELNTLILLNKNDKRLKELAKRANYKETELLDYKKVKVYIAEAALQAVGGKQKRSKCQTLIPADIDATGIEVRCFDTTIENMNQIQEEIIWGGDDSAN
ncbi:MAG: ATP-binding protein [Planctomycetaceae bacterium]|jgi:energy-coupling factor transporter ATP-binding protein EcfA2|nr:ATP-binding protein [Planctomycetaceae bacterium]